MKIIVKSWWIIVTPLLLALLWPKWGILFLFYLLSCFIILEYFKVSKVPYKKFGITLLIIMSTAQYLTLCFSSYSFFTLCIPLMCLWIVPSFIIFRGTISNLELVFSTFFGNAFVIYYLSHLPALTSMPEKVGLTMEQANLSLVMLLILTWGNDVFQFLAGKAFGKIKVVPHVSPNKTLAGFLGGIVGTMLLAFFILKPILNLDSNILLLLAFLISLTGMLGDLFFSTIKRNLGTKDFGKLLPGHGGLLDRFDSLIFTAPVFFHFLSIHHQGLL